MRITQRDIQIMKTVADFGFMTTDQISVLFFTSKKSAYDRLYKLYHGGYLNRVLAGSALQRMNTPMLYTLTREGAETLQEVEPDWGVNGSPHRTNVKAMFVEHTIAVNDVRTAITKRCQQPDCQIKAWRSEAALKADYDYVTLPDGERLSLIPDGWFQVQIATAPDKATLMSCVLEVDRGTMSVKRLLRRLQAYAIYQQSGAYQERFGTHHMRVVTVTSSETRCEHLWQGVTRQSDQTRFFFGVQAQMTAEAVLDEAIWRRSNTAGYQRLVDA